MSDTGQSEGMPDEKTITVYCAAESHRLWERTYLQRGDDFWTPDPWDRFDGERAKMSRRGGGLEFIDATGRVIPFWDSGRAAGGFDPKKIPRLWPILTVPVRSPPPAKIPLCRSVGVTVSAARYVATGSAEAAPQPTRNSTCFGKMVLHAFPLTASEICESFSACLNDFGTTFELPCTQARRMSLRPEPPKKA